MQNNAEPTSSATSINSYETAGAPWKSHGENVKVVLWQSHAEPDSLGHDLRGDPMSRGCPTQDAEMHLGENAGRNESEPRCSVVNVPFALDEGLGRSNPSVVGEDQ